MENNYSVGDFVYDGKIYDGLNTQNNDLQFYSDWFHTNNISKVLELCCGTGRLTIPLFESGIDISGVDFSRTMLEEAKIKASRKRLDIPFIEADMRCFELNDTFDAIFIPFNSIHHLYEINDFVKAIESIKLHLNKNGFFLLDYFNPDIRYVSLNENKKVKLFEYTTEDGRNVVINQMMKYENDTQINRIKWEYIVNGKYSSTENMDMRIYFPQELDYILESNGFKIDHKYGNFDQSDFNSESPEQIFICTKL